MKKILVVVDMQKDFVTGSLGTQEAEAIVPAVKERIESRIREGLDVVFTRDTHNQEYLKTQEGKNLPVPHCIEGTDGWDIIDVLKPYAAHLIDKPAFGSTELVRFIKENQYDEVELIGVCTDICVVSNALLIKANLPEIQIIVDAACCAGVTPETHLAALKTMEMCQVTVNY